MRLDQDLVVFSSPGRLLNIEAFDDPQVNQPTRDERTEPLPSLVRSTVELSPLGVCGEDGRNGILPPLPHAFRAVS